ncbi:MAG TPA: sigma-70 family RNA polymerase sigma factor [Flavobacterium sp.]|jgi:RNA polymerase sigma-70 factor (ECF subfamily)
MAVEEHKSDVRVCSEVVFRSIFDSHFKLLRNFLIYKYKDIERAEDVAQNAFVILWQNCGTIKPEQAKSFLFTTAIRLSLNMLKHDKVVLKYESTSDRTEVHGESPEFLMVEQELQQHLERAINKLPEKQRTVFLMNRLENQSYTQIAALLDLSVKTVEKRMHNALVALRKVVSTV